MRLALAVLASLVLASPAVARPAVTTVPAFPWTDGRSVAAWLDAGSLHVWRDGTPAAAVATLPALPSRDCRFGGVNAHAAGWLCGESPAAGVYRYSLRLEDLTTGALSEPPGEARIREGSSLGSEAQSIRLSALGNQTVRLDTVGLHDDYTDVYRLDGGPKPPSFPPAGSVADYDTKAGYRRVCAPAPSTGLTKLLFRAPYVLSIHAGRVFLRRCGNRTATLVGSTLDRTAVLTRRYAAWIGSGGYAVTVRMLASGKTYKFTRTPGAPPRLRGTDQRLWLTDDGNHAHVIDLGS